MRARAAASSSVCVSVDFHRRGRQSLPGVAKNELAPHRRRAAESPSCARARCAGL